jgi:hypothetical protein
MPKRILYTADDGSLAIIIPSPDSGLSIAEIAAKDVPAGKTFSIVNGADVPGDRAFRNAWKLAAGAIEVDLPRARAVTRARLREERKAILAALDPLSVRNIEAAADNAAVVAEKQRLRDLPALVDMAGTPDELRALKADSVLVPVSA